MTRLRCLFPPQNVRFRPRGCNESDSPPTTRCSLTRSSVRTRLQVLAGLTALSLAAACGGSSGGGGGGGDSKASAPGVTASTVTIGAHYPLTGPAAPGYSEIGPAAEAMYKYIND